MIRKSIELAGRTLTIETGRMARQADGAVLVQYGETVVLVAAVASKKPSEKVDFFPLQVEYRERAYAAGKIPGGFFKREGRPSEKEVLSARLVDRPIRPLFPKTFRYETQVAIQILSADKENDADLLGMIGASAALVISDIPFSEPIAAVRVGRIQGEFVINPTFPQLETSDMNVVIAASEDAILMVEGEATEISEDDMVRALEIGHDAVKKILPLQKELVAEIGKTKRVLPASDIDPELVGKVRKTAGEKLPEALSKTAKMERRNAVEALLNGIKESLAEAYPEGEAVITETFFEVEKELVRGTILQKGRRLDGRSCDDIRSIACDVAVLPRTHGSALFTRGETQSLAVTTLGTKVDEQKIEGLAEETWKSYMLHYNFPPFSVGETRPFRGPSRREIGHGNLAERALKPVIPNETAFPYTVRIVSDILESNGSSSMATVCAGSLSLMDAGAPVKAAVAGIAMGLVKEGNEVKVLTDILGDEDHLGDMDFKVAGTRQGITAFQMDIKISGISSTLMREALEKARIARMKILDVMDKTLASPRPDLSPFAPRIISIKIDVDCIGAVIGPGGKMIREIVEKSGAEVNIEDDGTVQIASADEKSCQIAKSIIEGLVAKPEEGKVYKGRITRITNFGAFVEILPNKEGLLHISEIMPHRINRVEDYLKVGEEVEVKLLKVTPDGKYELSRKVLLPKSDGPDSSKPQR
jgi:polyribonucleotide nucleotidyltransferase